MKLFSRKLTLKSDDNVKRLAEHLQQVPAVNRYGSQEHNEAWALAQTFADIEEEFCGFLDDNIPKLAKMKGEELHLELVEIGVRLQHILHHIIEHQEFYKYLVPPGTKVFGDPDDSDSYTSKFPPPNFPF